MLQLINHPKQTVQTCRIYIKYVYVCKHGFVNIHFSFPLFSPSTPYRRITLFFSSPASLHLLSSNRGGGSLRQAQPDVTGEKLGCPEVYLNKRARACALTHSGRMTVADPACALSSSPLKSVFSGDQGELTTRSCLCGRPEDRGRAEGGEKRSREGGKDEQG